MANQTDWRALANVVCHENDETATCYFCLVITTGARSGPDPTGLRWACH